MCCYSVKAIFLSTPSGWRATCKRVQHRHGFINFYPRPPGGGRLYKRFWMQRQASFLSTPSGWRATKKSTENLTQKQISIHALRVEGDREYRLHKPGRAYFYPRPPGGGRRRLLQISSWVPYFYPRPPGGGRHTFRAARGPRTPISIHALRVEGDEYRYMFSAIMSRFLSTPSGWRATTRR